MKFKALLRVTAGVSLLAAPALPQAGTALIVNIPGSTLTSITAINASGTMAGVYQADSGTYGFMATKADLSDYQTVDIGVEGGMTIISGVGPDGSLVGSYCDGEDCSTDPGARKLHAFLRNKSGAVTVWDHPSSGGHLTQFTDINARGQIVGFYANRDTDPLEQAGFLLDKIGAAPVPIRHPDTSFVTFPFGINSHGTVVGEVRLRGAPVNESLAFVWRDGALTLFALPDGSGGTYGTTANSINDRGEIVGAYWLPSPWRTAGYRLRAGVVTSIMVEGKGVHPHAINNAGTIVGQCYDYLGPAKIEGLIVRK